ncbi:hypothetical protein [Aminomonas paucivorans]|uniref:hypothetical protein n=1 Tax=Aminomonas paucivorans TaxID=81412 RepID=UPI00331F8BF1
MCAVALLLVGVPRLGFAQVLRVEGVPPWLAVPAQKSLEAVWREIPSSQERDVRLRLLEVVASRLFQGYRLERPQLQETGRSASEEWTLTLRAVAPCPRWVVELRPGDWSEPVASWILADLSGLAEQVERGLEGVPPEAFSWGDQAFFGWVSGLLSPLLPGWRASPEVRREGDRVKLILHLRPEPPLVLALTPRISSSSLPTLLHSELKEDLIRGLSPFVGVPVPYFRKHREEAESWAGGLFEDSNLARRARITTEAHAVPAQIATVDVRLESRRYTVWAWAAAYSGTEDRSTEVGLHVGRRVQLFPRWDMEGYGEWVVEGVRGDLESRWGLRWSPWGDVWLGGERVYPGGAWWGRFQVDPRLHKPYVWARFSEDGETQGALGWRLTEYLSLELHYDSRDGDPWSLRTIGNL